MKPFVLLKRRKCCHHMALLWPTRAFKAVVGTGMRQDYLAAGSLGLPLPMQERWAYYLARPPCMHSTMLWNMLLTMMSHMLLSMLSSIFVCLFVCLFVHGVPVVRGGHRPTKDGTYATRRQAGRRDPLCAPETDPSLCRVPEEFAKANVVSHAAVSPSSWDC